MSACMIQEDMLFYCSAHSLLRFKNINTPILLLTVSVMPFTFVYIFQFFFTDFLRIKMFLNHETVLSKGNLMELLRNVNKSFIKYES